MVYAYTKFGKYMFDTNQVIVNQNVKVGFFNKIVVLYYSCRIIL